MLSHLHRLPGLDFPNHQKSWYGRLWSVQALFASPTNTISWKVHHKHQLLAGPPNPPPTRRINRALQHVEWPWALAWSKVRFFLEILRAKNNLCTLVSRKGVVEFMPFFQDRQNCSDTKLHTYQSLLAIGWVHKRNTCWQMDLRNFYTRYNCTRVSVHTNKASVFALLVCQNNMFVIYCDYA